MSIYGRWGNPVTIVRMGTLDDVKTLDKRKPDKVDRDSIKNGSYIVCIDHEGSRKGRETLHHLGYLRADGGINEIYEAIKAVTGKRPDEC